MLRKYIVILILLFCCFSFSGIAQTYQLPAGKKYHKVKFELINNLMVIPIDVNGTELSFVLDSGVGTRFYSVK